ncbi:MAG: hypothetical protein EBU54_06230 [Mycobacteriaceae bacterium]|nr:hypothetical protein [Mycobacteriaceae bacterium]
MTLIATRSYFYNGAAVRAGDTFEAVTESDAKLLILVGSARPSVSIEAARPKRRRYARKNLTADHA